MGEFFIGVLVAIVWGWAIVTAPFSGPSAWEDKWDAWTICKSSDPWDARWCMNDKGYRLNIANVSDMLDPSSYRARTYMERVQWIVHGVDL